jgi:hypothetical protein
MTLICWRTRQQAIRWRQYDGDSRRKNALILDGFNKYLVDGNLAKSPLIRKLMPLENILLSASHILRYAARNMHHRASELIGWMREYLSSIDINPFIQPIHANYQQQQQRFGMVSNPERALRTAEDER